MIQEDNAPWYTSKMIKKYLANKGINRMRWPPQSPDLNPIENLWKYIKDMISKQKHKVSSVREMR